METKAEVWIPLTQGKVAVIDFDDFEKIRGTKWYAMRPRQVWYACRSETTIRNKKRPLYLLHRVVWGEENIPPGFEIAHKDGDGLNCRRGNLQCLTHKQNMRGKVSKRPGASSEFRGVRKRSESCWQARIMVDRNERYLGSFSSEVEAAKAYDTAAIKYFEEYASPNFPREVQNAA